MSLPQKFLLKEITTDKHTYLYCGRTQQIFLIDPLLLKIIPHYASLTLRGICQHLQESEPRRRIERCHNIVDRMAREGGFFLANPLKGRVSMRSDDAIERATAGPIAHMILEVTEACNFRCHYCCYSGAYDGRRSHGLAHMERETATRAIDFLFEKNRTSGEVTTLSFYGGEPLTQLPLIKYCVQYARSLPWPRPDSIQFNMTTNGSLLDEDTIRYVVANQVRLVISLDGPRQDHDAHRVYPDGGGTFRAVMSNLRLLREIAPGYPWVSINCIVTPTSNLLRMNQFFQENCHLLNRMTLNGVGPGHRDFFQQYPGNPAERREQHDALLQRYIDAHMEPGPPIGERREMIFVRGLFQRQFFAIHRRSILPRVPPEYDIAVTCSPGMERAFVDTSGRLHACERIVGSYPLGDIWSGFDLAAIRAIFERYVTLMNRPECLECWGFLACQTCFATMDRIGDPRPDASSFCSSFLHAFSGTLRAYCNILERKPGAFAYLDAAGVG